MVFNCIGIWGGWRGFCQWCVNTVPTIFDETLSYYEQICKLAETVKGLIDQVEQNTEDIEDLQNRLSALEQWKEDFINGGTKSWDELLAKYFQTPIFVGLTDTGYIFFEFPESWRQIEFNTTGYDYPYVDGADYGHLVLSY